MEGTRFENFFLEPLDPCQRRYEALRGVIVDDESMTEVAERLGVAHGTVRNWVCEFRRELDEGAMPPFFSSARAEVRMQTPSRTTNSQL